MHSGDLAHLRRARDLLDREYAKPLNIPQMARAALMSQSHFSRSFRQVFGETPYAYLQTRRVDSRRSRPAWPEPGPGQAGLEKHGRRSPA